MCEFNDCIRDVELIENPHVGSQFTYVDVPASSDSDHCPIDIVMDNDLLLSPKPFKPVTVEEIESIMLKMKIGKVPGPDGFTTEFYRHSWHIVKESVVVVV
ncbi:hypothetical protein LIER_20253 [Lithospermum erythrorhizon]|uniref:Reverse transcriptase n=1 Tax=Lithospermum erythrorhizon TaxID=34254 RepID=A0AAV3QKV7_LITER